MSPTCVHQIWLQGRATIPEEILCSMRTWIDAVEVRSGYRYVFWDEREIGNLLQGSAFAKIREIYHTLATDLYGIRADIGRLVVLHRFGGIYADADTRVLKAEQLFDHLETALRRDGPGVVIGTADLPGITRLWTKVTRRPSNFLLACSPGSPFVERYLNAIAEGFERTRIGDRLNGTSNRGPGNHQNVRNVRSIRSLRRVRRITKRWTGPKKLRSLLGSRRPKPLGVELTPVGFVASAGQTCFSEAAVAHDYRSNWCSRPRRSKRIRDVSLRLFLATRIDGIIVVVLIVSLLVLHERWASLP